MKLLDFFKKRTKKESLSSEEQQWNKMWEKWENEVADAPYQQLMTYISEVNNGGHSQFFFNVDNTDDIEAVVKEVLRILPQALSHNLLTAFKAYKEYCDSNEDRMDKILDSCDDIFYENEETINELLNEYADTMEV